MIFLFYLNSLEYQNHTHSTQELPSDSTNLKGVRR